MAVREQLTYNFRGRYTFAFRDFPPIPDGQIAELAVSEAGRAYQQSDSNEPGTFTVTRESSSTRVTWYFRADDERRTFDLSFSIDGAVRRYPDTAEFYYKFVGDGWDRPVGSVRATVRFPASLTRSDLRAWAHGPLTGEVQINADGTADFRVAPLPARQFWEGRILFPSVVVADRALSPGGPRVDAVLAEERRLADETNARRAANEQRLREDALLNTRRSELSQLFLPISFGLAVVGLLAWFVAHRRYGRPYDVQARAATGDIPSDHRPAVVTYLMSRHIGASALVATLLDLAHRGYLDIRETVESTHGFFGERQRVDYQFSRTAKPLTDLEPFERDLLGFLLKQSHSPTTFTMSALKSAASRRAFHKWFSTWSKQIKSRGEATTLFEPYAPAP